MYRHPTQTFLVRFLINAYIHDFELYIFEAIPRFLYLQGKRLSLTISFPCNITKAAQLLEIRTLNLRSLLSQFSALIKPHLDREFRHINSGLSTKERPLTTMRERREYQEEDRQTILEIERKREIHGIYSVSGV